jgi:hypothetical protein
VGNYTEERPGEAGADIDFSPPDQHTTRPFYNHRIDPWPTQSLPKKLPAKP